MAEWVAFNNLEGIGGEPAQNFRAGQICATVANFSTREIKDPLVSTDFCPDFSSEKKPEEIVYLDDPEDQARLIMSQVFGTTMEAAYGDKKNG